MAKRTTPKKDRRLRAGEIQTCRICGCVDENCEGCINRTGMPCHWIATDLCSACEFPDAGKDFRVPLPELLAAFHKAIDAGLVDNNGTKIMRELLLLRGVTTSWR